jgi:hypothetical protein
VSVVRHVQYGRSAEASMTQAKPLLGCRLIRSRTALGWQSLVARPSRNKPRSWVAPTLGGSVRRHNKDTAVIGGPRAQVVF